MFLTRRFYIVMSLLTIVVAVGYALPPLMGVGMVGVALLVVATAVEVALLYQKRGVEAWRSCDARFSTTTAWIFVLRTISVSDFYWRLSTRVQWCFSVATLSSP